MATTPYRALRVMLGLLSVLAAVMGLLMVFGGKSLLIRVFLHPPESEMSMLLLAVLKEMGGLVLVLSLMLFFAWRDPERNVATIDALIVGLCILAITPPNSLEYGHPPVVSELDDLDSFPCAAGLGGAVPLLASAPGNWWGCLEKLGWQNR